AVHAVGQRRGAVLVGGDVVVQDDIEGGARIGDRQAVTGVATDDVACRRRIAADDVGGGGDVDNHAVPPVGHGAGAGGIGPDVVAGDRIAGAGEIHAIDGVAGDDVAFLGVGDAVGVGADAVAGGAQVDQYAFAVGQRHRAASGDADVIA